MEINEELIQKYLAGNCSQEERTAVEAWLDDDRSADTDFSQADKKESEEDLRLIHTQLAEELPFNTRVLSVKKRRQKIYTIAAACVGIFVIAAFYLSGINKKSSVAWQKIHNGNNAPELITLNDGSKITLYPDAEISVPEHTDVNDRQLVLSHGKVYFDIVHNPARRFTVNTGRSAVAVLGTTFTIDKQSLKDIVTLESGRICWSVKGLPEQILHPGQQLSYDDVPPSDPANPVPDSANKGAGSHLITAEPSRTPVCQSPWSLAKFRLDSPPSPHGVTLL